MGTGMDVLPFGRDLEPCNSYLQSANCWLLPMVSGITAAGWTELCKATPGSCCQVEGSKICWVPPGQACCKTTNTDTRLTRLQFLQGQAEICPSNKCTGVDC